MLMKCKITKFLKNFKNFCLKVVPKEQTYPADFRKIFAVDSHNFIGIESKRKYQQKLIFV